MPAYQPLFHITNQMLMYVSSVSEKIGEINVIRNMEKRPHLRKNNRINREAEIRDMLKYSVFFWYFFALCYHGQKHYISSMFYLKRQRCPYQKFYYIQENLDAFHSLSTAERSWRSTERRRRKWVYSNMTRKSIWDRSGKRLGRMAEIARKCNITLEQVKKILE